MSTSNGLQAKVSLARSRQSTWLLWSTTLRPTRRLENRDSIVILAHSGKKDMSMHHTLFIILQGSMVPSPPVGPVDKICSYCYAKRNPHLPSRDAVPQRWMHPTGAWPSKFPSARCRWLWQLQMHHTPAKSKIQRWQLQPETGLTLWA
jgi:hypothetical protein